MCHRSLKFVYSFSGDFSYKIKNSKYGDRIVEVPTVIEFTTELFKFIENFKQDDNITLLKLEIKQQTVSYLIEIIRKHNNSNLDLCEENLLEFSQRFNDIHTTHTTNININILDK